MEFTNNHLWSLLIIAILAIAIFFNIPSFTTLATVLALFSIILYFSFVAGGMLIVWLMFKKVVDARGAVRRYELKQLEENGFIWRGKESLKLSSLVVATHAARNVIIGSSYRYIFTSLLLGGLIMILFSQVGSAVVGVAWFLFKFFDGTFTIILKHKIDSGEL